MNLRTLPSIPFYVVIFGWIFFGLGRSVGADYYDEAPIWYAEKEAPNVLHQLEEESQESQIWTRNPLLFLEELLKRLEISPESQVLVISKTSLQKDLISPSSPRALYFNENHYVGYVPGGDIEVMFADGEKGTLFYRIKPPIAGSAPSVQRDSSCLSCHASSRTQGIPGFLMRSVTIDHSGAELAGHQANRIGLTTPFFKRWGGWVVTADESLMNHKGNQFQNARGKSERLQLEQKIDFSKYVAATSDVLPLILLSHQVDWHNTVTKSAYDFRRALWFFEKLSPGIDPFKERTSVSRVLESASEKILEQLLFYQEAEISGEGPQPAEKVRLSWLGSKKESASGHSLRDLRLYGRIFKYRCSYMIYSESFESLPERLHTRVFEKIKEVLLRQREDQKYDYLSDRERTRILLILKETYPQLPKGWAEGL